MCPFAGYFIIKLASKVIESKPSVRNLRGELILVLLFSTIKEDTNENSVILYLNKLVPNSGE